MQDQYVGDVGDFGKYGLLRALCGWSGTKPKLSLGVVWYVVPSESHKNDGRHVSYLSEQARPAYRECDPDLYDELAELVQSGRRTLQAIQKGNVLPRRTRFYDAPLTFDGMPGNGSNAQQLRMKQRNAWLTGSLKATEGRDLVFVDPDNGLESRSYSRTSQYGPKYVYFDELAPHIERGHSLVVYHHFSRSKPAQDQVTDRLAQLSARLVGTGGSFALIYHRGTARAFFVLPARRHRATLLARARRVVSGPWGEQRHFELVLPGKA